MLIRPNEKRLGLRPPGLGTEILVTMNGARAVVHDSPVQRTEESYHFSESKERVLGFSLSSSKRQKKRL